MTVFDGLISGDQSLGEGQIPTLPMPPFSSPASCLLDVFPYYVERHEASAGLTSYLDRDGMVDIHSVLDGVEQHSFGDDNLFFRIWFEPTEIDAGFIVEDKEYSVKIWNAYFGAAASLSVIDSVTPDGTSLDSPTLPKTIAKFGDLEMTLTVLRSGPPAQSTTYIFTINGLDYDTDISGLRVLAFAFGPDYSEGVRLHFIFETAISMNRYFREQRRPLRDRGLVNIALSTWARDLDAQKLKHYIKYGHDRVFGVPVYSEQGYPSQEVNGQTTIQCSNDLTKHWFLNNQADYVVLIQFDNLTSEIKEVSSIGASSITLERPVTETFEWRKTIVFPVVLSVIADVKFEAVTDNTLHVDVEFQEYRANE